MKPLREEIADSLHGGGCTGDYADYLEKADEIIEIYKQQWTEVSDQFPPAGEKVFRSTPLWIVASFPGVEQYRCR